MLRFIWSFAVLTAAVAIAGQAEASGTLIRTFVSSVGNDSNPCTIAQPCASFAAAYAAAAPDGIVAALDPGKYGPLTITGPITIDGNGWAAITAPSSDTGIGINAGSGDSVILRGLVIDGVGAANNGIFYNSGGSLTVVGCAVRNMLDNGIYMISNDVATPQSLVIADSHFTGIGGAGIEIDPFMASGKISVSINQVILDHNGTGVDVNGNNSTGPLNVTVTDTVAANNSGGFSVSSSHSAASAVLTRVQVVGNQTGVSALGIDASLWLGQSTVTGNGTPYAATQNGTIITFQDNFFNDNGAAIGATSPTSTN
jgi:hypothetical protein